MSGLRSVSGLAAGIIVVGVAVVGCGQSKTAVIDAGRAGGARVSSTSLCADQAMVSKVRVVHIPSVAQLDPSKPGMNRAVTLTIANPARARALARAVCALPGARRGGSRCAMNFDGQYQLSFSVTHVRLPVVVIHTVGCQQVTGAGQERLAASPGFWATFSRATGIPMPAHGG